jgi:hypothetical protein
MNNTDSLIQQSPKIINHKLELQNQNDYGENTETTRAGPDREKWN